MRSFYDRDALELAPDLLNKVLVHTPATGRASRRASSRSEATAAPMIRGATPSGAARPGARRCSAGPAHLYVYFSYGNHWCMNAVCGPFERPVLLRSAAPLAGVDTMRERRDRARRDRDLCAGPGRLGQAFGVDRSSDGIDLVRSSLRIVDDGVAPPARPGVSVRIGLAVGKGETLPYRFYVPGDDNVSAKPR